MTIKEKSTLKMRREDLALTQKQVAEEVGIALSAYQRYELTARIPNARLACKIASALKTTVECLYGN